MKSAQFLSFLSIAILSLTSTVQAQIGKSKRPASHLNILVNKVDGTKAIELLANRRTAFNKSNTKTGLSLSQLPKAEYIFDRSDVFNFTFEGLEFSISDNKVIAIKGFELSQDVLAQITEKLVYLDRAQVVFTEKTNDALLSTDNNAAEVKNSERRFFTALKVLTTTLKDIATITKKNDNSAEVALNLSKLPMPNIDIPENSLTAQSLVQRTK